MKKILISFAVLASAFSAHSQQQGISRVSPGGVQPVAAPMIAPQLPPAVTPTSRGPMPTPLPAGVSSINLKEEALDRVAPMPPQDVLEFRREIGSRSDAMQQPLKPGGKPVRRVISLDLSPGASPEVFRTAFGQGGVVTILDAAGRPWPILDVDNFSKDVSVALLGVNGVSIGLKTESARQGSIAVRLEGLPSPVTFSVVAGQAEIDYSLEMQVARYLPGAPAPVGSVEGLPTLASADLMNYLLGTPPKSARPLTSDGGGVKAWQTSPQTMIVRTEALLASPRFSRRQSSANGMTVYELPLSPKIILASQGQMQSVAVSGFEGTKEQQ